VVEAKRAVAACVLRPGPWRDIDPTGRLPTRDDVVHDEGPDGTASGTDPTTGED
jgi:hypothetical protein